MIIRRYSKIDAIDSRRILGQYWKPILFWGHTPKDKDVVGKECLSQWYPCRFNADDRTWSSAEEYMMCHKAVLFDDHETERQILAHKYDPVECKRLGRHVKNFDSATWDKHKCHIVFMGNLLKFTQNPALQDYLRSTGVQYLVEASPSDDIWGIGMSAQHKGSAEPLNWKGQNLLGYILMEVRDCLTIENP